MKFSQYRRQSPPAESPDAFDVEFSEQVRLAALSADAHIFVNTEMGGSLRLFLNVDLSNDERSRVLSRHSKSHFRELTLRRTKGANISGALIRDLIIGDEAGPIELERCYVGLMRIRDGVRADIELRHCWIGNLVLGEEALARLSVTGGSIRAIESPPPHRGNPFVGSVTISDVVMPTTPKSLLLKGPQTYSNLRSHLEKLGNVPAANLMRARELATERHYERGLTRLVNWIYEFFGDHGLRAGRPLAWAFLAYGVAFALVVGLDGGKWSPDATLYFGWRTVLTEQALYGDIARSAFLCLQSIINPFGIFGPRSLVVPGTVTGQAILAVQGLFTDLMLFLTILGIRRRFKLP